MKYKFDKKDLKKHSKEIEKSFENLISKIPKEYDKSIAEVLKYSFSRGNGRRWRSFFSKLVYETFSKEKAPVKTLLTIELIHQATLMIDDIEDDSNLRRGKSCTHKIFGIPLTINAGTYMIFLALRNIVELDNPKLIKIYLECLEDLHKGQSLDLYNKDWNEDLFWLCYKGKAGALIKFSGLISAEILNINKKEKILIGELGSSLGLSRQLWDDFIDFKKDLKDGTSTLLTYFFKNNKKEDFKNYKNKAITIILDSLEKLPLKDKKFNKLETFVKYFTEEYR